jgi:CubicO group peptidase (beta-lactamase class C family)
MAPLFLFKQRTEDSMSNCILARRTLPALLLALAPTITTAQNVPPQWRAPIEKLATAIRADVARDTIGGITAAVVQGGDVVWAEGFGWADRDKRIPADAQTIYRIGSISKSFTAVALAQLAARGTVNLDDPAANYLAEINNFAQPRAGAKPVTLRHLATHTAGIIREPRLQGAAAGPIAEWENRITASIPLTSFDTLPGARYAYSNIGYGVLGLTISRAARVPFMQLVADNIFKPLRMQSSTFVITPALASHLAVGYSNSARGIDTEAPKREHDGRGYKVPNGGIYSTVGDLAHFIGGMTGALGDAVLDAKWRSEVMRVQTPENPRNGYGLGFSIRTTDDGRRLVSHGGSVAGYTAHIVFDPDARIGVILLRNYNSGRTNLATAATSLLSELVQARQEARRRIRS